MGSLFLTLNVSDFLNGGFSNILERFFNSFGRFIQNKHKNHQNIGYLDLWKLQSGEIIIETERFAKLEDFSKFYY